ncbi:MAG TPA: GYF domain-containing protein [Polyangiaceae bacterium]
MMVESASSEDWSASNAPPIHDDEKWHVALAPGEVKIVSLEQLDDLFRLSIVDSDTNVWQEGMTEWQPLGVVAGIEDKPPPEPKRTHPKPPSPRSSPPPAPRRSVPSPPRPPSRAPAAAASFYPQAVASASFYPELVAVAPVAKAAPLGSVRPLVVSQAPRVVRQGGGLGRVLLGLAAVAGLAITLYRNGIVRGAATGVHQEALYERLETALGGPAFGTLRAVEQNAAVQSSVSAAAAVNDGSARAESGASAPTQPAARALLASAAPGATPPIVSLESLAPEKKAAVAFPKPEAAATIAPAPVRALTASPPLKSETATPTKSVSVRNAPAAPVVKPAPVSQKSEAQMTERERLNAAIGRSMLSPPPAAASKSNKSKSNEYDPLNPKL